MYEQGPIRPPSEASSLLVRVTRNCPWNRYLMCPAYKGTTFSKRAVDEGTFFPMSDEEIVAEIRLLLSNLDEMHTHFRCSDFSLNLLMGVDGYLDSQKDEMLHEIDTYLSLSKRQKQAYSFLHRSGHYFQRLDDLVREKSMLDQISSEIEKMEKNGKDEFNKYIRHLMSYQLPQPQTDNWT